MLLLSGKNTGFGGFILSEKPIVFPLRYGLCRCFFYEVKIQLLADLFFFGYGRIVFFLLKIPQLQFFTGKNSIRVVVNPFA